MNRMNGKKKRSVESTFHVEMSENSPNEDSVNSVKQDVEDVKPESLPVS
jgi:hypothetical protein